MFKFISLLFLNSHTYKKNVLWHILFHVTEKILSRCCGLAVQSWDAYGVSRDILQKGRTEH